ncbi:hypothetical protein RHAB21_00550 [Pseudorhizobium halotolerans]|uniref:Secreted protein n=1 Tax=Pseudorhizobium halotolerans TaxID=1233081 RepID=A0ABM8PY13_9HYPH|nr:hypothetical protein RHAB21_00550 [Pseudorhizobium halotolerans]
MRPASCSICIPVLTVFLFRCGAASFSLRQPFQEGINPISILYRLMLHMGLRCCRMALNRENAVALTRFGS